MKLTVSSIDAGMPVWLWEVNYQQKGTMVNQACTMYPDFMTWSLGPCFGMGLLMLAHVLAWGD